MVASSREEVDMVRSVFVVCIAALFWFMPTTAVGSYLWSAAPFLLIHPGARQVAMGGAACGLADDALATHYNPAGLAFQRCLDVRLGFALSVRGLYPDRYEGYGSAAVPVTARLTLAPAVTYVTAGEFHEVDPYGTTMRKWRADDYAVGIYCGLPICDAIGIGGGVKFVRTELPGTCLFDPPHGYYGAEGKSVAFDIGVLAYYPPSSHAGRVGVGIALQNLGPSTRYSGIDLSDPLARSLRIGVSLTSSVGQRNRLCMAADMLGPLVDVHSLGDMFRESWRSAGIEFVILEALALRFGLFNDPVLHQHGVTWGAGLHIKSLRLDVANDSNRYEFKVDSWKFALGLDKGNR